MVVIRRRQPSFSSCRWVAIMAIVSLVAFFSIWGSECESGAHSHFGVGVDAARTLKRRRRPSTTATTTDNSGDHTGMDDILNELQDELNEEEKQQPPPSSGEQGDRRPRRRRAGEPSPFDQEDEGPGQDNGNEGDEGDSEASISPNDVDRRNVAAIEIAKEGRLEAALEEFKAITELDPGALSVFNNLGVTYMRLGMLKEAYDTFSYVLNKESKNEDAVENFKTLCPFMDLNADVEFVKLGFPFLSSLSRDEKTKIRKQLEEEKEERERNPRKLQRKGAKKPRQTDSEPKTEPVEEEQHPGKDDEWNFGEEEESPRASGSRDNKEKLSTKFGRADVRIEHNVRSMPRVPVDRLYLPENRMYAEGKKPFILTGLVNKWNTRKKWTPKYLAKTFPDSIVDFYSQNMDVQGTHPFLVKLPNALHSLFHPEKASFPLPQHREGRYIQWNVKWHDWQRIKEDLGELPFFFKSDEPWLNGCLPSDSLRNEFLLTTHWRMVLIGDRGAGMFNHVDTLRTSSFQLQLRGRKLWHICAPSETQYIGSPGNEESNMFAPDYEKRPWLRNATCYFDIADEGEALFYPRDYWHQTENLDTPTIAITGTLVDKNNYDSVTEQLAVDCHKKPLKLIHPSETLCRYYYQHCFPWWKIAYGDAEANYVHVEDAQDLKKARTSIGLKNERGYDTNWKTEVVETSSPGQFGCQLGSFDSADQSTHSYGFDEFYG